MKACARPDGADGRRRRRGADVVAAALVAAVAAMACTASPSTPSSSPAGSIAPRDITFATVDAAMNDRIVANGLPGAGLLVVRGDRELHHAVYGSFDDDTVVAIASASKWLTSATIMTLVDEGKVHLDDPIGTYLPSWDATRAPDKIGVTLRRLLSHQAGVPSSAACVGDPSMTLGDCADEIAGGPLDDDPGTAFHYGNAGYTVAARVAEVVGGAPIESLFQERIATPIGMTHTSFVTGKTPRADGAGANPVPAASARSTLRDFGRFVAMMWRKGTTEDGRRLLSEASVDEIERDQVSGLDTADDFAVKITGFGTYGLGVWRDRAGPGDVTQMVSGSGSGGFYPWIDRERRAYGVLLIDDAANSAGDAVRASTHLVHDLVLPAIDNQH
jgi:CubicO group peptidase (beta-lactamase class C family)